MCIAAGVSSLSLGPISPEAYSNEPYTNHPRVTLRSLALRYLLGEFVRALGLSRAFRICRRRCVLQHSAATTRRIYRALGVSATPFLHHSPPLPDLRANPNCSRKLFEYRWPDVCSSVKSRPWDSKRDQGNRPRCSRVPSKFVSLFLRKIWNF